MTARRGLVAIPKGRPAYTRGDHWSNEAACRTAPERDVQIMTDGSPHKADAQDLNKRYCTGCPVRLECFNWAYDDKFFSGVAGGHVFVSMHGNGHDRRVISITQAED